MRAVAEERRVSGFGRGGEGRGGFLPRLRLCDCRVQSRCASRNANRERERRKERERERKRERERERERQGWYREGRRKGGLQRAAGADSEPNGNIDSGVNAPAITPRIARDPAQREREREREEKQKEMGGKRALPLSHPLSRKIRGQETNTVVAPRM